MSKEIVIDILKSYGLGKVMIDTDSGKVPYKGKDGKVVKAIAMATKDIRSLKQTILNDLQHYGFSPVSDDTVLVSDWRNHNTVLKLAIEKFPLFCVSTGRLPIEYQEVLTVNFKDIAK